MYSASYLLSDRLLILHKQFDILHGQYPFIFY
nr:MAG TPA: hypothetical protein [Caudoviricetes sp.]